ncbi:MAG: T9SS type A sorting domain-containing protein [Bacteroidota bacterium]
MNTRRSTILLALTLCIAMGWSPLRASRIFVSTDIGFDPANSTPYLQWAFDSSTEDTIVVDDTGLPWKVSPLYINRNDVTIILEQGVVIEALPGVFDIFESLIRIQDRENISIIGYGAALKMQKQEYVSLADSEFRHGISMQSSIGIHIEGLLIEGTGGDGLYIGNSFSSLSRQNYCENITVVNCKSTNNYRQGLSIISAKNVSILNCEFSHTNGTLPEDGIDIEPDVPEHIIQNILIKGCRIFNNNGRAIQFALTNLDDSSSDVSVVVEDTYMSNNYNPTNAYAYTEIMATDNYGNGVDGQVLFRNCLVKQSEWSAVYARKTVESYSLDFENCVFKNVSNDPIQFNNPIFFEVTDYFNNVPRFGGANFTDCTIVYDANIPFLSVFENAATSAGLGNITGNFFVISPNDNGFEAGTNPNNVNINYEYFASAPASSFNISANQLNYLEEDGVITYDVARSGDLQMPMAISLEYQGTAAYGLDYSRAPGFLLFPPNVTAQTDVLTIIQDELQEGLESLDIQLVDDDCVIIGNRGAIGLTIDDAIPLPVELLSFRGAKKEDDVHLVWETASEVHSAGFEIERSTDGIDWLPLSFVESKQRPGGPSTRYEYTDKTPQKGANYYRLKQMDFNGAFEYSNIVLVDFQTRDEVFSFHPNPTANFLQIKTSLPRYSVHIFDVSGKRMLSFGDLSGTSSLELASIPTGVYFLEMVDTGTRRAVKRKLVKQ